MAYTLAAKGRGGEEGGETVSPALNGALSLSLSSLAGDFSLSLQIIRRKRASFSLYLQLAPSPAKSRDSGPFEAEATKRGTF